ncbi:hypothetical protein LDENG_00081990 [Lucifuga dentata]|nr:hypothetical protein LDENG_00081990 [Lucifuga dentata]
MTTTQVLNLLLLHSFMVSSKKKKTRLQRDPLLARVLYGSCEKLCKIFIMEADLGEEVTKSRVQALKSMILQHDCVSMCVLL